MVKSWKWFWIWMVLSAVLLMLARVAIFVLHGYGWIIAAFIIIAAAPVIYRIEYKITGKERPRAKKP